jgi:hypothetical protein
VLTSTDARGITLAYSYDSLGRKTGVYDGTTAGFKRAGWQYDTSSSIVRRDGFPALSSGWDVLSAPGRSQNRSTTPGTTTAPSRTGINLNDLTGVGYTLFAGNSALICR